MDMKELHNSLSSLTGKTIKDIKGAILVTLSDGTEIYLEHIEDTGELYIFGNVASIPEERFGRYALQLLEANLFGKDTGGTAVLAYDREECRVVIWDRLLLDAASPAEFQERFSYLYLSKLHWSNKMREDLLGGDLFDIPRRSMVRMG